MKYISYSLLIIFSLVSFFTRVQADELSAPKNDKGLVPVKMISLPPSERSETTFEYDKLVRITRVKTTYFEEDNSVKYSIEKIITYDDLSQQYRDGNAYIVASLKIVRVNDNLSNPIFETEYSFTYERVSPVEYTVKANDGHSITNYSVDAKSGLLLDTSICRSDDPKNCLSIEYVYNISNNIIKMIYRQAGENMMTFTNTYDNNRGAFSNTQTPQWLLSQYLSPISSFGLVNNKTSQQSDDICKVKVTGTYTYNKDGYPIKYISITTSDSGDDVQCIHPSNLNYSIEYLPVNKLK